MSKETAAELPVIVIKPSHGWVSLGLRSLWAYRELLYFLTWRDIKVRYKQTALGAAWAVIQPFMAMVVFSIFLGRMAGLAPKDVPYPLFSYAGLVPWTFFANGVSLSANSLVGSQNLLKKVYFPRMTLPIGTILSGGVDFALAFVVLVPMHLYYRYPPTINVLWIPLFLALAFGAALGVGLWLSAMNVLFRDVRYVVPFLVQLWLFATPVVWPSDRIPEAYRSLIGLNPMAGVVEGFQWALLGWDRPPGLLLALSVAVTAVLLVSGAFYFRRMEKTFADMV
ncbi:MAG: ABC transporter permease [Thermoleophilia bacterium]|nr:ABC transporter permease [Thermoleophilia bacterium]